MLRIRLAQQRGGNELEWLKTRFAFSFDRYYDPDHMGFGHLRVLNEDWISPGGGFPMHPHRDMEIVTYILEGALEHKDSTGHGAVIQAGRVQRMTAGTGILHSEFNPSETDTTHLLQIWIHPRRKGLAPSYEERKITGEAFRLVASPDGREESAIIQQDLDLFAGRIAAGESFERVLAEGNKAWVQIARGAVEVNGTTLDAGDGAALSDESVVSVRAVNDAEVLVFDMRM